ncbi:MAG: serine hydrolase domain-containing protein [Polyangiaceae bacterium]
MDSARWAAFDAAVGGRGAAALSFVRKPGAVAESHWSPHAAVEPAFLAYSITKTFIATCVLQLWEARQLDLGDLLSRWFPKIDRAERISLRQLLNHTAGVPDYGSLPRYHDAIKSSPSQPWSFEQFANETFRRGLAFEPGSDWSYSNVGYMLLRAIVEIVSGQSLSRLLSERVFRPLGLTRTFVPEAVADLASLAPAPSTALSKDGAARDARLYYHPGWVSHGVVASTASDIARFFDALFAGSVLSRSSLEAMTTLVAVPPHCAPGVPGEPSYGLGLMGDPTTPRGPSYGHGGGGPSYQAHVHHLAGPGITVCVMAAIERDFDAQEVGWRVLQRLVDSDLHPSHQAGEET